MFTAAATDAASGATTDPGRGWDGASLPARLGPYELVRQVGKGGMASVYEARRHGAMAISTRVALKVLHPHLNADERFLSLFVNEAALSAQLHHPNVVQLQELGREGGHWFLAMELVDGCDLAALLHRLGLRDERMPLAAVTEVLVQVLTGLGWVHRARQPDGRPMQLIHRDLKPANVLLSRHGAVKVADFGIAHVRKAARPTTNNNDVPGTLHYMSPEQLHLRPLTQASDLFSVGLILYEMLMGRPLVARGPARNVISALLRLDVEQVVAEVPAEAEVFRDLLRLALAPDPAQRYGSAEEMLDDVNARRGQLPEGPVLSRVVEAVCDEVGAVDPTQRPTQVESLSSIAPFDVGDALAFDRPSLRLAAR